MRPTRERRLHTAGGRTHTLCVCVLVLHGAQLLWECRVAAGVRNDVGRGAEDS